MGCVACSTNVIDLDRSTHPFKEKKEQRQKEEEKSFIPLKDLKN